MVLTIVLTFVFTTLLILGGGAWYVYKNNPFNIQACVISSFLKTPDTGTLKDKTIDAVGTVGDKIDQVKYDHPLLNDTQETMLKSAGIDVETLPATISPETENCFIEALGKENVEEIKAGATPGALDLFKAKSCL